MLRFPDRLERAVLTDIPNNPGMQGGPLVSREGAWLGVIGRIVESRSTNTTLTFAVPMDVVRAFVLEAAALDEARLRPALPPRTGEAELRVDTGLRLQRTHLRNASLAYIERVVRGSAAEAAGVRADDLVFRVGRRTVHDTDDYDEAMRARSPGEQVEVWVKRGRQVLRFEWTLEAR